MPKTQDQSDMDDPKECFAWMFGAGIPDARDPKYPHQPMIPGPNMPALSEMLYKMGARFHPELQELWVKPVAGPDRNFIAGGVTDLKPIAEMLADQYPEKAAEVAAVTPETYKSALEETTAKMLDSIARLQAARANLEEVPGGGTS